MDNKNFNLEEKDIYKLFNNVRIEESEFDNMDEKVTSLQKKRLIKNLNKKIKSHRKMKTLKYCSIVAAISIACLFGVSVNPPAFAKDIPVIGSIIETLNKKFDNNGEYARFSQQVNKSSTDNGITLTINEALADDSKLIVGYTIKSEKEIKGLEVFGVSRFLSINGRGIDGSSGGSIGKYIDKYTYVGSEEIHTKIPKKSRFNVDFKVDDIMGIKGKWKVGFSVSKEELAKRTTTFKPNCKVDFPDSIANIDKVVFSPINTSIFISGNYKDTKGEIKGIMDYDFWIAYDDKGRELTPQSIGGGSSNSKTKKFKSEMSYEKLKSIPKYLTIIPCRILPAEEGCADGDGKVTVKKGKPEKTISKAVDTPCPIELPQGKFGKLIINEVKKENNKIKVNFIAEGKAPYFQATSLRITDDIGEVAEYVNYEIKRSESNSKEFTINFEVADANKKYNLTTSDLSNVDFAEDLKFNINFK